MGSSISRKFTQDFTVLRPVPFEDAGGAVDELSTNLHLSDKGHFQPLTNEQRVRASQIQQHATHVLFVGAQLDIVETDRIQIEATIYEIVSILRYTISTNPHLEIRLFNAS